MQRKMCMFADKALMISPLCTCLHFSFTF